jgi:hypothetical protein
MKRLLVHTALLASGILGAVNVSSATEATLHIPSTPLAQQQIDLLRRTQHALTDFYAKRAPHNAVNVTNAWYYPTAQSNVVFVQLPAGDLLLVEMDGNRVAQLHDLTTSVSKETAVAKNR